jgi:tetratricopeptide (TPR) repeat protein
MRAHAARALRRVLAGVALTGAALAGAALGPAALVGPLHAQGTATAATGAAEQIAAGDRAHARHDAAAALAAYEAAARLEPRRYDALWKAARAAVDLGEASAGEAARQRQLYRLGETYARRATEADARDAEGHFALARALGRTALAVSARDRVKYAEEIRAEALRALALDPAHAGALHVMGMWHAEVMRLNGIARMIAKNFLGGQVFGTASWAEAQRYLEEAVRVDPQRIVHQLDLALIYRDVGKQAKARELLESVMRGQLLEPNDARYKREAAAALRGM